MNPHNSVEATQHRISIQNSKKCKDSQNINVKENSSPTSTSKENGKTSSRTPLSVVSEGTHICFCWA